MIIKNCGISKPISNEDILNLTKNTFLIVKLKHFFLDSIYVYFDNNGNYYHSNELINRNIYLYKKDNYYYGTN